MCCPVKRFGPCLLALLLAVLPVAAQGIAPNRNVRFGLPAPATTDPSNHEAFLIGRPQYVLSYNAKTKTPNWVSWELKDSDIGNTPRRPFESDRFLPKSFPHVTTHVYDGSGFDRGHMCPAKDRSASAADSEAVFYLTNIIPQAPHCNQQAWERLEDYCRRLAKEGKTLHIVCGPAGVGGVGANGPADEIGKGRLKVTVPHKVWKVVLVLPRADAEPRKNTRVIAVVMPNDQTVDMNWPKYRTSARHIEKLTGCRFFRNVADAEVANALREHVDDVQVRVAHPPKGKDRK